MASPSENALFKGPLSPDTQSRLRLFIAAVVSRRTFAHQVSVRLVPKEVELFERGGDGTAHVRAVYEIAVSEDMLNAEHSLHSGCVAYIVDVCSAVALAALGMHTRMPTSFVSRCVNLTFHSPVTRDVNLEAVTSTVTFGSHIVSTATEIWDVTNRRLCITATHDEMVARHRL